MRQVRIKSVFFNVTKSTKEMLDAIAKTQNVPLPVLFRKCLFKDYKDKSALVRGDDVFEFCEAGKQILSSLDELSEALVEKDSAYFDLANFLFVQTEGMKNGLDKVYVNTEKIRSRIKKYCLNRLLPQQQKEYTADAKGPKVRMSLRLNEREYETLNKMATDAGKKKSQLLVETVISKCAARKIYVDSYPLDEDVEKLQRQARVIRAICSFMQTQSFSQKDIDNLKSSISEAEAIIYRVSVPGEQKETRKEATRILRQTLSEVEDR